MDPNLYSRPLKRQRVFLHTPSPARKFTGAPRSASTPPQAPLTGNDLRATVYHDSSYKQIKFNVELPPQWANLPVIDRGVLAQQFYEQYLAKRKDNGEDNFVIVNDVRYDVDIIVHPPYDLVDFTFKRKSSPKDFSDFDLKYVAPDKMKGNIIPDVHAKNDKPVGKKSIITTNGQYSHIHKTDGRFMLMTIHRIQGPTPFNKNIEPVNEARIHFYYTDGTQLYPTRRKLY